MIFKVERTVEMHDGHLDFNEWLADTLGDSTRIEQSFAVNRKDFDPLYQKYALLRGGFSARPRYAVDVVKLTEGPKWKTVVAIEYEGEEIMHEDWVVQIKDDTTAVHFKLMTY